MDMNTLLRVSRSFISHPWFRVARSAAQAILLAASFSIYGLVCSLTVHNQIKSTQMLHERRVALNTLIDGTGSRPFVYRRLTPTLIQWTSEAGAFDTLQRYAPEMLGGLKANACAEPEILSYATCDQVMNLAIVLTFLIVLFAFAMHAAFLHLYHNHMLALAGTLLTLMANNAIILRGISQIYDFGSLFFSAVMILAIFKRKNVIFTIALLLGCINKETAILFSPLFLIVNILDRRVKTGLVFFTLQIVTFVCLTASLHRIFRNNPGAAMEIWFRHQPGYYLANLTIENLVILLLIAITIVSAIHKQTRDLKVLALVLPVWACLMAVGGYPGELRNLTEILPILVMLAYRNIVTALIGAPLPSTRPRQSGLSG